jgi:uncharacterized protein (TIGR03435 family)
VPPWDATIAKIVAVTVRFLGSPGFPKASPSVTRRRHRRRSICQCRRHPLNRSVINSTGLTGGYVFTLQWKKGRRRNPRPYVSVGRRPANSRHLPYANSLGPLCSLQIQGQPGLELALGDSPAEILVIDSAEKPAENQPYQGSSIYASF